MVILLASEQFISIAYAGPTVDSEKTLIQISENKSEDLSLSAKLLSSEQSSHDTASTAPNTDKPEQSDTKSFQTGYTIHYTLTSDKQQCQATWHRLDAHSA